jgi:hypothetical protein
MPVYPSAPDDSVPSQNLVVAATGTDIEIGMGIPQFLHLATTMKECFKLFVGHMFQSHQKIKSLFAHLYLAKTETRIHCINICELYNNISSARHS